MLHSTRPRRSGSDRWVRCNASLKDLKQPAPELSLDISYSINSSLGTCRLQFFTTDIETIFSLTFFIGNKHRWKPTLVWLFSSEIMENRYEVKVSWPEIIAWLQWAKIVLVVEQSVSTEIRSEQRQKYSQPSADGDRIFVVRWHQTVSFLGMGLKLLNYLQERRTNFERGGQSQLNGVEGQKKIVFLNGCHCPARPACCYNCFFYLYLTWHKRNTYVQHVVCSDS